MKKNLLLSPFCFILILLFYPISLLAAEYHFEINFSEVFITKTDYFNRGQNSFSYDENINLMIIDPNLFIDLGEGLSSHIGADLSWEHFFTGNESQTDEVGIEFRDFYLDFKNDNLSALLGLQPIQFGNGLIFIDDVPAVSVTFNLDNTYINLSGSRIFDASPIIGTTIGFRPGPFQHIEAFAAWFKDRDDAFSETLHQAIGTKHITNSGHLNFLGISGELFVGNAYLTVASAYQQGKMKVYHPKGQLNLNISSFFFDIGIETNLTDQFSLGLFCFTSGGDDKPLRGDLSAFISPFPYNSRASIFFDIDFLDHNESNSLIFGGQTVYGVITPGITFTLEPIRNFFLEGTVAEFYTQNEPSNRKNRYGWETDLRISMIFNDKYNIFLEAARFEHGNFFETDERESGPTFQLFVGCNLLQLTGFK